MLMKAERRRVGRPRQFDIIVSVRLTKEMYDTLSREALARGEDVSIIIREHLQTGLIRSAAVDRAVERANPPFRISKLSIH
jgi:hypothetical protein